MADWCAPCLYCHTQLHAGDEWRSHGRGRSAFFGTPINACADIFLEGFRAAGYLVGDNEPYSGKAPQDFTIDHHAESNGLPHVGIEIRQDLIDNDEGVEKIAAADAQNH